MANLDQDIRAGDLTEPIVIKEPPTTQAADGSLSSADGDYTEWGRMFAAVYPQFGRELRESQKDTDVLMVTVVIRWRTNLPEPKMRVYHESNVYEIVTISHIGSGRKRVELNCKLVN